MTSARGTGMMRCIVGSALGWAISAGCDWLPLVETDLVAFDVLHHQTRLIDAIRTQKSHAYRAERDQSGAFRLQSGQALFTNEPASDPHVQMQPILDDLPLRNALEEQSGA